MTFSIKDFFSKSDQIRSFLRNWSHLLRKSLTGDFIFCAVKLVITIFNESFHRPSVWHILTIGMKLLFHLAVLHFYFYKMMLDYFSHLLNLHQEIDLQMSNIYLHTVWFIAVDSSLNTRYCKKMKFSIKDFSCKCDLIRRKLRIWSHLLEKSLMENFIFCAVRDSNTSDSNRSHSGLCSGKLNQMSYLSRTTNHSDKWFVQVNSVWL